MSDEPATFPDFSNYGCPELAAAIEEDSRDEYISVSDIEQLEIAEDNRHSYDPPSGDTRALVLRCTGDAMWPWGRDPAVLELSIDANAKTWLDWKTTGNK